MDNPVEMEYKERVLQKLDKVFHLLGNPVVHIEDDTVLDSLLICIRDRVESGTVEKFGKDFVNLKGVQNILEKSPSPTQHKKITAFVLKLCAKLGSLSCLKYVGGTDFVVTRLFSKCSKKDVFSDASIREAWFCSLETLLMAREEHWNLILECGALDHIFDCLTDSSLFVSKSAVSLLKNIVEVSSIPVTYTVENGHDTRTSQADICDKLLTKLRKSMKVQESDAIAVLSTCSELCRCENFADKLVKTLEFIELLSDGLKEPKMLKASTQLGMTLLERSSETLPVSLINVLADRPQLVSLYKVDDAMRTAAKLVVLFRNRYIELHKKQLEFLRHPFDLLVKEGDTTSAMLCPLSTSYGKGRYRRATQIMVCRSMEIMEKYPEVESCLTFDEVVLILEATVTGGATKTSSYLHESNQVQKSTLDYIKLVVKTCNTGSSELKEVDITKLVNLLKLLMENAETEPMVVSKCLDTLNAVVSAAPSPENILFGLGHLIQRLLCDVRWEVRDSALIFVAGLSKVTSGNVQKWILDQNLVQYVKDGFKDNESYVRATALAGFKQMASSDQGWTSSSDVEEVLKTALSVIGTDNEAFPRRAAASLLCYIEKNGLIRSPLLQEVYQCMMSAGKDFDWEVKLFVLDFWNNIIRRTMQNDTAPTGTKDIPSYAQGLYPVTNSVNGTIELPEEKSSCPENCVECLSTLHSCGCLGSLLTSLGDYDQSVKAKACKILADLRSLCVSWGLDEQYVKQELLKVEIHRSDDITDSVDELSSLTEFFKEDLEESEFGKNMDHSLIIRFLSYIFSQDFQILMKESEATTDDYASNPESLLDDIIAWATGEEDILVDCY